MRRSHPGPRFGLLFSSFALFALAACMVDERDVPTAEGVDDASSNVGATTAAIVDGTRETGEPAVVVVKAFSAIGLCTGTLISPHVVLTAKHCVQASGATATYPPSAMTVGFGDDATSSTDRRVIRVRTTPGVYTSGSTGLGGALVGVDVAVITLLDEAAGIEPIVVGRDLPTVGEDFTAIGFGNRPDGPAGQKYKTTSTVESIRSGVLHTSNTICPGDSGGPAILEAPTRRVVGVASFGVAEECPSPMDGYNLVEPFLGLIDAAMIAAGDCPFVAEESCNSIDDDCNGTIDEGCKAIGEPCTADDECAFSALPDRFDPLERPVFCGDTPRGRICTRACDPLTPHSSCETIAHPFSDGTSEIAGAYCAAAGGCEGVCVTGNAGMAPNDAACTDDTDCASLFCHDPGDGRRRCVSPCEGGADRCASDEVCAASVGTCGACVPPSRVAGAHAIGEPCAAEAECASSVCLVEGLVRYCSAACGGDAECPDGFHCRESTCARGGRSAAGASCLSDGDCNGGDACSPEGYCTHPCTIDEVCPEGFSCQMGSCGPDLTLVGDPCASDAECASAACVEIDGVRVCSTPCGGEGRCTAGLVCRHGADGASLYCARPREIPPPPDGGGCSVARRGPLFAPRSRGLPRTAGLFGVAIAAVALSRSRRRRRS